MDLTCFKAYDVRGELGANIDAQICYRIGRSFAQILDAKSIVVGRDARETSPELADAVSLGIMDAGADVLDIGLSGTEEMYWSTTEFAACGGIEVTASHNPINYNGLKMVKAGSKPLDPASELPTVRKLAEENVFETPFAKGSLKDITSEAKSAYVTKLLSFVDATVLKPLKVVVNSGNGAAGPTFDAIATALGQNAPQIEFIRVQHQPDHTFPNGIPNPLLPENHAATADVVMENDANLGVAFDGDFDRCFFFDEKGHFIDGEYIVGLLADVFLDKVPGASIVHDPRIIWNTQSVVAAKGGTAVQSKTGHAFIKQIMREVDAVYGGEMSAHHYFRDFAYCDSGMIPWLLVIELMSRTGKPLSKLVTERIAAYPSSGEVNFRLDDPKASIAKVIAAFEGTAEGRDETDGISLSFADWRFNLRISNTEPVVRLNIEAKADRDLVRSKLEEITKLLQGSTAHTRPQKPQKSTSTQPQCQSMMPQRKL